MALSGIWPVTISIVAIFITIGFLVYLCTEFPKRERALREQLHLGYNVKPSEGYYGYRFMEPGNAILLGVLCLIVALIIFTFLMIDGYLHHGSKLTHSTPKKAIATMNRLDANELHLDSEQPMRISKDKRANINTKKHVIGPISYIGRGTTDTTDWGFEGAIDTFDPTRGECDLREYGPEIVEICNPSKDYIIVKRIDPKATARKMKNG